MNPPTTARDLLAALRVADPAVEGGELVFGADPPAALLPALDVLHTGVRALLSGRRWYGTESATGRGYELNPAAPIPARVTLLCVDGDGSAGLKMDRIDPTDRIDLPALFESGAEEAAA